MFKVPKYQLYLLQLENYELGRYLRLLLKKGLLPPGEPLRKKLIWTNKAILIFVVAEILIFALSALATFAIRLHVLENTVSAIFVFIGMVVILKLFSFLFFSLAAILIWPIDYAFKRWIIARAKFKIVNLESKIKIIGIAGSYGKTTMKEVLKQILGVRFQVLATPESVNTPVGIARWILRKINGSTEILIVEMGEHYRGDIIELCKLTPPDIAVIAGINEAHIERMGNVENVEATIFEIAKGMKPNGLLMLNGDGKNVMANYQKYSVLGQQVEKYQVSSIKYQVFDTQALYWKLQIDDISEIKLHLLGEYALGNVDCAIKIAKTLGMSNEEIKIGIEKIRPVSHRLEPIRRSEDILVIDDAYNGNSNGAWEAIKVLACFKDRRKIYITPGLVETGSVAKEVHIEIGRQLASVADVVILIKNSVTGYIAEGIGNELKVIKLSSYQEKQKPEIIWFDTASKAHTALKDILEPNDVILFQNDWGDQYT